MNQEQWHRMRDLERRIDRTLEKNRFLASRCEWLERRPAWWKPWAVKRWKEEEPK